jgi:hypothetical protein
MRKTRKERSGLTDVTTLNSDKYCRSMMCAAKVVWYARTSIALLFFP